MILPKSELKLMAFDVLSAQMTYVSIDELADEIDESRYVVDLDFDVTFDDTAKRIFVFTTVAVNSMDAKFPCHVIEVSAGNVFEIEKEGDVSQSLRDMYVENSAIPIAFNNIRGFIQNITSYCPIGAYILPLFLVSELIMNKFTQNKDNSKKKASPKKKATPKKAALKK